MFYHNTIRRYTLLLLDKFKNLEVQYRNSNDEIVTKNIPIHYKVREKEFLLDKSEEQIVTGNTNVLPRATLELTSLSPNTERQAPKMLKINRMKSKISGDSYNDFQWNAVSYDFSFTLSVYCRGMSEVCQIIEEVAPKFNPIIYFDVYDAECESSPTRVPLQLSSIDFSNDGYDETSINTFVVTFELLLSGYLFQPVNAYSRIKEYYLNLYDNKSQKEQMKFDVVNCYPQLQPDIKRYDYSEVTIEPLSLNKNGNEITVIYNANVDVDVSFECENCEYNFYGDVCTVNKSSNFVVTAVLKYGNIIKKITKEF